MNTQPPRTNIDLPKPRADADLPGPRANADLPGPRANADLPKLMTTLTQCPAREHKVPAHGTTPPSNQSFVPAQ